MPKIHFIDHTGAERIVETQVGTSVMQTALDNLVPGIVGDCGGSCSCATCHAYVDADWIGRLPSQSENEKLMLEGAFNVEANSRLTCQIVMTAELDGLVVQTPPSQF